MINFPEFQAIDTKLTKTVILAVLITFISVINDSAQNIIIEQPQGDGGTVCGHIENEQLTIPAYKFRVTDKDGNTLKNLRAEGELVIEEGVYMKNGFFDLDPYWKFINHNIQIPVIYDPQEDLYITRELSKVSVGARKKNRKCLNKITELIFSFYQNDSDSTSFIFFFPNKTIDKIDLPDPEKVYNLGITIGYSKQ